MSTATPGDLFFNPPAPQPAEELYAGEEGPPTDRLGDAYAVLKILRGGMGEIYICERLGDSVGRPASSPAGAGRWKPRVALKTFQKRLFFDRACRHAFLREASLWCRLTGQPYVMPALGVEEFGGRPFVRMVAITPQPGQPVSLRDLLRRGPLGAPLALRFAYQVALGLCSANKKIPGMIHGDMKPENLLLVGEALYVSDFGLARSPEGRPDATWLEGTWAYRAPELWEEGATTSVASDVYAYGIVLWEMVTGHQPLRAEDRDGWSRAHRSHAITRCALAPGDGLREVLLNLAERCLSRRPADRPETFDAVLTHLLDAASLADKADSLRMITDSIRHQEHVEALAREIRPELINALNRLDEPGLALCEIDAVPEAVRDALLWRLRGTALSLLNRDSEAIADFERALGGRFAEESQRHTCLNEYALSLKRLRRFEEAADIYEELLPRVSEDEVPSVVTNLATVYLQRREPQRALALLEPFTRRHPDVSQAWANLAVAYQNVGRAEEAARTFQKAFALAPQDRQQYWVYAQLCMDQLGWIKQAAAALDLLFDLGGDSREWIVRFAVCNILLDRKEVLGDLLASAFEQLDEQERAALMEDIEKRTEQVHDRLLALANAQPVPTGAPEAAATVAGADAGPSPSQPRVHSPPGPDEGPTADSGATALPGEVTPPVLRITFPLTNFRYYGSENFTLDFYYLVGRTDYTETFLLEWRQVQRDPRLRAPLRVNHFYFTCCPACGLDILTNRNHGKNLRCRGCKAVHRATPLRRDDLDRLLREIHEQIGVAARGVSDPVHVLLVEAEKPEQVPTIEGVLRGAGFALLPPTSMLSIQMFRDWYRRGLYNPDRPYCVAQLKGDPSEKSWRGATPAQVESALRELRKVLATPRTLSATFSAAFARAFDPEGVAEAETELRARLARDERNIEALDGLIKVLIHSDKLEEAQTKAKLWTVLEPESARSWAALGGIQTRRGRFTDAIPVLERATRLDPLERRTQSYLHFCFTELGLQEQAEKVADRIELLGGWPF
jgi:serine/threonine protein kinase/Tfp pilus assembly protein PilF